MQEASGGHSKAAGAAIIGTIDHLRDIAFTLPHADIQPKFNLRFVCITRMPSLPLGELQGNLGGDRHNIHVQLWPHDAADSKPIDLGCN